MSAAGFSLKSPPIPPPRGSASQENTIPAASLSGRNGGIHLLNDFVLDKAVLSEAEKQEILAASQSIHITRNMDCSRTLQKLSALFQLHSENWLEVDFSRWGNPGYDNETFELLKSAVIRCRNVKLRYAGSCEEIRERTVQPYKLVYKAKAWYLQAFCTEKQDWRVFKLNSILELDVLEEGFSQLNPPRPIETFEGEYPKVTLGTRVDILSPAHLKEAVAEQAKLIYEKNRQSS